VAAHCAIDHPLSHWQSEEAGCRAPLLHRRPSRLKGSAIPLSIEKLKIRNMPKSFTMGHTIVIKDRIMSFKSLPSVPSTMAKSANSPKILCRAAPNSFSSQRKALKWFPDSLLGQYGQTSQELNYRPLLIDEALQAMELAAEGLNKTQLEQDRVRALA